MHKTAASLADTDVLELLVEGREIAHLESRPLAKCSTAEQAALAHTFRSLANAIEDEHLEAPAEEVFTREDPTFTVTRADNPDREQRR